MTPVFLFVLAIVPASRPAQAIDRGRSYHHEATAPPPVVLTPADRVRVQMADKPDVCRRSCAGKFEGSIVGLTPEHFTVALDTGAPYAVVHRDLVTQLEVRVDHGSAWKHALVAVGIAAGVGAAIGATSASSGDLAFLPATSGHRCHCVRAVGLLIAAILPSGVKLGGWQRVPMERVSWSPDPVSR